MNQLGDCTRFPINPKDNDVLINKDVRKVQRNRYQPIARVASDEIATSTREGV